MKALQGKDGDWLGPVGEDEVLAAEEALGVVFPPQYRQFLLEYGSGVVGAYEIYGLGGDRNGVPHLLWLVDDLEKFGLKRPPQLIPFHAEGNGDYSAILAAPLKGLRQGSVVYWSPRRDDVLDVQPAYDSLEDWFADRLG